MSMEKGFTKFSDATLAISSINCIRMNWLVNMNKIDFTNKNKKQAYRKKHEFKKQLQNPLKLFSFNF